MIGPIILVEYITADSNPMKLFNSLLLTSFKLIFGIAVPSNACATAVKAKYEIQKTRLIVFVHKVKAKIAEKIALENSQKKMIFSGLELSTSGATS